MLLIDNLPHFLSNRCCEQHNKVSASKKNPNQHPKKHSYSDPDCVDKPLKKQSNWSSIHSTSWPYKLSTLSLQLPRWNGRYVFILKQ